MKLNITNLQKSFGRQAVLTGVTYVFEKGKIYGLLGRNGAGKTTMFHCLSGGLPFNAGKVTLELDGKAPRPAKYDDIGFVFAQPHLPEFMTGYEFMKYFIETNRDKISGEIDIGREFAFVDFAPGDCHKLIKQYSHGMQNKLQFLAFLVLRPPVILLDEPLTSFDVVAALQFKNMLKSLKENHIIIFSTHMLALARDLCDEIVVLRNGKLSALDSAKLQDKDFENRVIEMLTEGRDSDA